MSSSFSSKRIVLVDPLGEILFSGESIAQQAVKETAEEPCPETKRSALQSGLFRAVSRSERPEPSESVTEAELEPAAATQKRGGRAA